MDYSPITRLRLPRCLPRRLRRRGAHSRGQTIVEVGLILPIFILSLIAVIEFGYFVAVSSAIATASREGARYGSTVDQVGGVYNYVNCSEIQSNAQDLAGGLIDLTGSITVSYERNGASIGNCGSVAASAIQRWDRVVVTVSYSYNALSPLVQPLIGPQTLVSVDRRSIVKP